MINAIQCIVLPGVGAIPYVMNCNVTIETSDLEFGKEIAESIRATTKGGLPGLQSMAFHHKGDIEIACNVEAIDTEETEVQEGDMASMIQSFGSYYHVPGQVIEDRIRALAQTKGVRTKGTALVGFSPEQARAVTKKALSENKPEFWRTRDVVQM